MVAYRFIMHIMLLVLIAELALEQQCPFFCPLWVVDYCSNDNMLIGNISARHYTTLIEPILAYFSGQICHPDKRRLQNKASLYKYF